MERPQKNASELRQMILAAVSGHPICPKGMDLKIVTGGDHEWSIECIPPAGQHLAYAGCCDLMTGEGHELRAKFGLKSN